MSSSSAALASSASSLSSSHAGATQSGRPAPQSPAASQPPPSPLQAWNGLCETWAGSTVGRSLRAGDTALRPATHQQVEALAAVFDHAATRETKSSSNPHGPVADPSRSLDRLYAAYLAHTPAPLQSDLLRTAATLNALMDAGIAAHEIERAVLGAWLRDLFADVATAGMANLGAWYAGSTTSLEMTRRSAGPTLRTMVPSVVICLGARVAGRFIRKGGLGPCWSAKVHHDGEGKSVPLSHTPRGFATTVGSYSVYVPALLCSDWRIAHPALIADPADRRLAAMHRDDYRRTYNLISAFGVGLFRALAAPAREYPWLNALDRPGDPPGYRAAVMRGAIQELNSVCGTMKAAARYVTWDVARGLAGTVGLDRAWRYAVDTTRRLRLCSLPAVDDAPQPGPSQRPTPPVTRRTRSLASDLRQLLILMGAVLFINVLRGLSNEPAVRSDARIVDSAADMALLLVWGIAAAANDLDAQDNASIVDDAARRRGDWERGLAVSGGWRPSQDTGAPGPATSRRDGKGPGARTGATVAQVLPPAGDTGAGLDRV